jgi:2-oxoglutarate ferredoxin oxidoreductase subunit gamma
VLACLSQEAYDKYSWIVRPGGLIIVDRRFVKRRRMVDSRQVELDMNDACASELDSPLSLNCCLLGAIAGLIDIFALESITRAVADRFPERFRKVNTAAAKLGYELVRRAGEKVMRFKEA